MNRRHVLVAAGTVLSLSFAGCSRLFDDDPQLGGAVVINELDEEAAVQLRVTVDDEEAYTAVHRVEANGEALLSPAWPTENGETVLEARPEGVQEWFSARVGDTRTTITDDTCVVGYVYLFSKTSSGPNYIEFRRNGDELPAEFQC